MTDFGAIGVSRPLVLVGGGRMGSALLAGWLGRGLHGTAVVVVEPDADAAREIKTGNADVTVVPSMDKVRREPAVVVLAVKPQVMAAVLRPRLGPGIGAAADAHGVTPASSRSNTSMKALWRCWVMRSLIVRASLGT